MITAQTTLIRDGYGALYQNVSTNDADRTAYLVATKLCATRIRPIREVAATI